MGGGSVCQAAERMGGWCVCQAAERMGGGCVCQGGRPRHTVGRRRSKAARQHAGQLSLLVIDLVRVWARVRVRVRVRVRARVRVRVEVRVRVS